MDLGTLGETQILDNLDTKLYAAMDRQHPSDLFDIMHLQAVGEIPDEKRLDVFSFLEQF